jgi:hypothetical protein
MAGWMLWASSEAGRQVEEQEKGKKVSIRLFDFRNLF